MLKCLFFCLFALQMPIFLQAQLEIEAPMLDPDLPPKAEDLFSKFVKRGNNIFELPNEKVAKALIEKNKIQALEESLLSEFFKVKDIFAKGDRLAQGSGSMAFVYYPYTLIPLENNITAYITLQEGEDFWLYAAYTFDKDFNPIDEIVLAQSNAPIKAQWNADNSIVFTEIKRSSAPILIGEKKDFQSEITYKTTVNNKGIFSKKELLAQKGLAIDATTPQNKKDLPTEIYLTGNLLKTVAWSDKIGQHFALVSYANTNDENSTQLINAPITLYFYHYTKQPTDKKFDIVHQSKINVKACKLEVEKFFANSDIFYFADSDNNQVLELYIPYWMSCRADAVNQIPMQLLMWEGNREFFQLVNVDVASKKGQYTFTSAWQRLAPAVVKYANEIIEFCAANTKI